MTYIPHRGARSAGLGATATTASTSSGASTQFFNIEEIVGDIVEGVTGEVVQGVTRVVDRNMDQVTSVVSDGLSRFVDSPKGTLLFNKIGDKAEQAVLQVVSNQKTNIALLGIAGVAFMIGSVAVGSKIAPIKTKLAFGIGAAALAAVALGVGSPPTPAPPLSPFPLPTLPKKTLP